MCAHAFHAKHTEHGKQNTRSGFILEGLYEPPPPAYRSSAPRLYLGGSGRRPGGECATRSLCERSSHGLVPALLAREP